MSRLSPPPGPTDGASPAAWLVVTAVESERRAVLREFATASDQPLGRHRALSARTPAGRVVAVVAGVGPAPAAAVTADALAGHRFEGVFSMGVAGGFPGRAEVGEVVVADLVVPDLGTESAAGVVRSVDLGWETAPVALPPPGPGRVAERLRHAGLPVRLGGILTVTIVTGSRQRLDRLIADSPVVAEAMEGHGVLVATAAHQLPFLEVRVVSNRVGERGSWDLSAAGERLAQAAGVLFSTSRLAEDLRPGVREPS